MATGDKSQGWVSVVTATTSNATPLTLGTLAISDDHACAIWISLVARRFDGGFTNRIAVHRGVYVFARDGGGAVLHNSEVLPPIPLGPPLWGWAVTVDADGNNARLRVTGAAGEDVRWVARAEIIDLEQPVAV
jgi:hypothetical protein